jgi:hypothetical protein
MSATIRVSGRVATVTGRVWSGDELLVLAAEVLTDDLVRTTVGYVPDWDNHYAREVHRVLGGEMELRPPSNTSRWDLVVAVQPQRMARLSDLPVRRLSGQPQQRALLVRPAQLHTERDPGELVRLPHPARIVRRLPRPNMRLGLDEALEGTQIAGHTHLRLPDSPTCCYCVRQQRAASYPKAGQRGLDRPLTHGYAWWEPQAAQDGLLGARK